MEINTNNPTAWELDSRAAAFHRNKRSHDLTMSDDHSSSGSANSTPRKRARRAGRLHHQDVRDFVPPGASFSSTPIPLDERPPGGDDGMHVEPIGIIASENDRIGSPIPEDTSVFINEDQTLPSHDYSTSDVSTNGGAISKDEHALGTKKFADKKLRHKIGDSNEPTNSTIAPITWNPVNSIKIRTKLGGNSHKEAVKQVEQASKDQASEGTREKGQ